MAAKKRAGKAVQDQRGIDVPPDGESAPRTLPLLTRERLNALSDWISMLKEFAESPHHLAVAAVAMSVDHIWSMLSPHDADHETTTLLIFCIMEASGEATVTDSSGQVIQQTDGFIPPHKATDADLVARVLDGRGFNGRRHPFRLLYPDIAETLDPADLANACRRWERNQGQWAAIFKLCRSAGLEPSSPRALQKRFDRDLAAMKVGYPGGFVPDGLNFSKTLEYAGRVLEREKKRGAH